MNDSEVSKLCKGSLSSAKNFEINVIVFSIYMIVSSSMMLSLPYIRNSGFFILVVCFIFLVLLCLIFNYLTISFIGNYMDKSDNKRSLENLINGKITENRAMWATILSSSVCFIWSGVLLYMVASTYDPIPTWLYIIVLLLRIFMIFIIINVVFSVYTLIYNLFSKSKKRLLDSN